MRQVSVHKLFFGAPAGVFLALPALLVLAPDPAVSTTESMRVLPAFNKFECVLCHTSSTPVAGVADLNAFGSDFNANGKIWNRTLAEMNSDGDRCLNGFELGDQDGDGKFDGGGDVLEHSNPGDPADCNIALNQATWGIIKDIFSQEIRQYFDGSQDNVHHEFSLFYPQSTGQPNLVQTLHHPLGQRW